MGRMTNYDIKQRLENIKSISDLYYVSLIILLSYGNETSGIVPDLAMILDEKSLFSLISCYAGKTIKIPSMEQLQEVMSGILVYYYYEVKHWSWNESLKKAEVDPYQSDRMHEIVDHIKERLSK